MKRTIAAGLVLSVLLGMVTVFAVGSETDPLITRSYLEGAYLDSLKNDINATLGSAADSSINRLNELQRQYASLIFASKFTRISIEHMDSLILSQGASFTLSSGTAELQIARGTVINVSTGAIVTSGSQLVRNQRYFCAENTSATFTATSAVTGYIDGYYRKGVRFLPPSASLPFTDIPFNAIYIDALAFAYANGIVTGSGGRFFPDDTLTRASFALMLHRYAGRPNPSGAGGMFSDVTSSNPAFNAVTWAHEQRIVTGAGGRFNPNDSVTRESLVLMIFRYHVSIGRSVTSRADALNPFADRGSITPAATDAMRWAVSNGLMTGSGNRLNPGDAITRASTILILFRYFNLFGGRNLIVPAPHVPPTPAPQPPFADVPNSSPAFNAINWAHSNGLVTGTNDGRFLPEDDMTRAQYAAVLWRYSGRPAPASSGRFADVPSSHVAHTAITWVNENGIVTGVGDRFMPDDKMTREQMVLMMYRYSRLRGRNISSNSNALDSFTDRGEIHAAATEAMRWAVTHSLITGNAGRLLPNDTITRAQVVLILFRYNNTFG